MAISIRVTSAITHSSSIPRFMPQWKRGDMFPLSFESWLPLLQRRAYGSSACLQSQAVHTSRDHCRSLPQVFRCPTSPSTIFEGVYFPPLGPPSGPTNHRLCSPVAHPSRSSRYPEYSHPYSHPYRPPWHPWHPMAEALPHRDGVLHFLRYGNDASPARGKIYSDTTSPQPSVQSFPPVTIIVYDFTIPTRLVGRPRIPSSLIPTRGYFAFSDVTLNGHRHFDRLGLG